MSKPQGYALITGASSGIGEEFARQLAARGWSLILVARSRDRLEKLRGQLIAAHPNIDVRSIPADLSASDAPLELFERTRQANLTVTLLINSAGFGAFGEFSAIDRKRQRQMLDLNIAALTELSHLYMQPMFQQPPDQRSRGGVINVASVAGYLPLPYSAVYAATKAFVASFTQSLAEEAQAHGIHVMLVNPGSTSTNFFAVAGNSPFNNPMRTQTAAQVVRESLRAFDRGATVVTTGAPNRFSVAISGLIPRKWVASVVGKVMRRHGLGSAL